MQVVGGEEEGKSPGKKKTRAVSFSFLLLFKSLPTPTPFFKLLSANTTTHDSFHKAEKPISVLCWRYRADLML